MKEFNLPEGWKFVSLYDLVDVIGGVSYAPEDITSSGVRVIRGGNIQGNLVKLKDDDVFLPNTYKNCDNSLHKGDVILVASTGSVEALGRTATVWENMNNVQIGAFLRILRPKQAKYASLISAWLTSAHYFKYIRQVAKGTSINNISLTHIKGFKIPIPTDEATFSFTALYNAVANRININREINQSLEALAKQIYDYWFVQFDFPDENGRPYKSSGGKMVWNKELNREIPSQFRLEQISQHTQVLLGGTPDTQNANYWDGTYPWLNSGEVAEFPIISSEKNITEEGLNSSATVYAPKGSVTLSITRHLRPSILAIDACINQSVVAIKETEEIRKEYLYPFIKRDIPRLMTLRTGAQQPHINKETVDKTWLVIPDKKSLSKYYDITKPIYENIINNAFEMASLTKQRDELLPLLMNGQVIIDN